MSNQDRQDGDGLLRDIELIGAALEHGLHPSGVTHAFYRIKAALATPQPTRDAAEGAGNFKSCGDSDVQGKSTRGTEFTTPQPTPDAMRRPLDSLLEVAICAESNGESASKDDKQTWAAHARKVREAVAEISVALSAPAPPADGAGKCSCGPMCQDLGKAAGCRYLRPERAQLRFLVDAVYMHATEGQAFPSTDTADKLIDCAFPSATGAAEPVVWRHTIVEPGDQTPAVLLSHSQNNPWSHWTANHLSGCKYTCVPLYAAPPREVSSE